jgi:hypothetical protein
LQADENFGTTVASVADQLLTTWRDVATSNPQDSASAVGFAEYRSRALSWHGLGRHRQSFWAVQTRQRLLYHLNASGQYFAFKEQLKQRVLDIVRERFSESAKSAQDQLQAQNFISQLYVYLSQRMHARCERWAGLVCVMVVCVFVFVCVCARCASEAERRAPLPTKPKQLADAL